MWNTAIYLLLQDEGEKNIDKIIQAFFASINSIKKESNEKLEKIIENIILIEKKNFNLKKIENWHFQVILMAMLIIIIS